MKALTYNFLNKKFVYKEVPTPEIKDDELLVEVKSSALCGTDLHIMNGSLSKKRYGDEIVLGHSFAGTIKRIGKKVKNFKEGDRVFVSDFVWCGKCGECLSGKQNLCDNRYIFGMEAQGSHAEFIKVPEKACFLLPKKINFDQGSLICDLLAIVHHAIRKVSLLKNSKVLVFGCGPLGVGLGMLLKNFQVKNVLFVDTSKERRMWAGSLLGRKIISPSQLKKNEYFDVVFDACGSNSALELGFKQIKRGGKIVVIGVSDENFSLNTVKLISREVTILGSYEFDIYDVKKSLELILNGKINLEKLITHRFLLKNGSEAYKKMADKKTGKVIIFN